MHIGNHFSKAVNYNTTFCKLNFIKYGLDGLSLSFAQFQMVYIFLEHFFRTPLKWSNDASEY